MTGRRSRIPITVFLILFLGQGLFCGLYAIERHTATETALLAAPSSSEGAEVNLGSDLPLWSIIPFIGILLSIAIFPLVANHFWHHHYGKVSLFWALLFAIPFLIAYQFTALQEILHIYFLDYFPFIILLWALYTVSGGLVIRGSMTGTPVANTIMLLVGSLLASWIGTTGAAMVLVRPFIKMNKFRVSKVHLIVFFIFMVANVGGSLTPLGDPPLFLGFLKGVPFFWTLGLFSEMALVLALLLLIFFLWDSVYYRREGWTENPPPVENNNGGSLIQIEGSLNFIFLLGIIGGVLFSGSVKLGDVTLPGTHIHIAIQNLLRDAFLILMGFLSLRLTDTALREANEFTWFPIEEVGKLFAGIFVTIIPALAMLQAGEQGHLGFIIKAVKEPAHYFWVTGLLSSFLDNAPTYLVFLNTACGQFFSGVEITEAVHLLIDQKEIYLKAVSTGAVFFGAVTYIGNAPNFMVKSIAEQSGIKMPSFFGFMLYSGVILGFIFILVTMIFFPIS